MVEGEDTFQGTHGTSASKANLITKNGFEMGTGRAGKGIYFWLEGAYSKELAVGWHAKRLDEGGYLGDENTRCAVIHAILSAASSKVLDLTFYRFRNRIGELRKTKQIKGSSEALYDFVISELEGEMGVAFAIILAEVAPPLTKYCDYPLRDIGPPVCCISRDRACITVQSYSLC